jgi:hypothetical protein
MKLRKCLSYMLSMCRLMVPTSGDLLQGETLWPVGRSWLRTLQKGVTFPQLAQALHCYGFEPVARGSMRLQRSHGLKLLLRRPLAGGWSTVSGLPLPNNE